MWRYLHLNGENYGPADLDHLLVWLREGRFGPEDWIWNVEEERWGLAKDEPAFAEVLGRKIGTGLYQANLLGGAGGSRLAPALAPDARTSPIPENLFEHETPGGRHYVRFETLREGRYCVVKSQMRPTEKDYRRCRIVNISIGGLGFETKEAIERGHVLRLEFTLEAANDELFRIQGRVVRTAPGLEHGFVEHGIQFLTLPEAEKRRLILFLERELGENVPA